MNDTQQKKISVDIAKLDNLTDLALPTHGSWPESIHQFDEDSIYALKAALAAQRPLLLRGDPGTGKSQLARAAAIALQRLFVYDVITAHTESQDLLWRFDAVARLAEVQSLSPESTPEQRKEALDSKRYLSPGPLWWALCWKSAHEVYENSQYQLNAPEKPSGWEQANGSVLLIDEIDKANAELPNGLLEILGNNAVSIPWLKTTIGGNHNVPPLVIITTNEERELPAAFIRRCLVLNLELPNDEAEFKQKIVKRGLLHFAGKCEKTICEQAAEQLYKDRSEAKNKGITNLPGQAEYLDMLRALSILGKTEAEQKELLDKIAKFTFVKYPKAYGR
jgi:MoxR-like ATPase